MKRFSVLLALTLLCANPLATIATESEAQTQLAQLETKFFGHTYETETPEARADRLENLILGDVLKGDTNQRIKNLTIATSSAEAETNRLYGQDKYAGDAQAQPKPPQTQRSATNEGGVSKQDYPHIDFLEGAILGQTYGAQPLGDRLARMETKAFGAPSTDDDMSARTDALEDYLEHKLHKKGYPVATADNPGATSDAPGSSKGSGNPSRAGMASKQLLMLAANTLLGLSGIPMGFGAYPPGTFGPPSRKASYGRTQSGQQLDASGDEVKEDPAVLLADPPPATARVITKVGWCEMQVFGRTYGEIHLEERLTQLSRKLNLDAGQTGLELMDHIDDMVKSVRSRKSQQGQ